MEQFMTVTVRRRRGKSGKLGFVQKPDGVFTDRVRAVGPEHFGIVSVDCAKARSRYMLADYYGTIHLQPTTLPHSRGDFEAAIARIRQALAEHELRDHLVAIERT